MKYFDATISIAKELEEDFSKILATLADLREEMNEANQNQDEKRKRELKKQIKEEAKPIRQKLHSIVQKDYLARADEIGLLQFMRLDLQPLYKEAKEAIYPVLAEMLTEPISTEKQPHNSKLIAKVVGEMNDSIGKEIKSLRLHAEEISDFFDNCSLRLSPTALKDFPHSCFLTFQFTLAKPLLTKDDDPFHFLENPIRQDWVFKIPVFEASSWKGCLNSAVTLRIGREMEENRVALRKARLRLFGSEKELDSEDKYWEKFFPPQLEEKFKKYQKQTCSEEGFRAGRLHFFPTFFDAISLEVLNPHDRNKRAGKNPVWLESIPAGQTGTFQVLYFPFDLIGTQLGDEEKKEIVYDLRTLLQAIYDTFRVIGFGAKHLSGYGRARNELQYGHIYLTNGQAKQLNSFADVKDQAENGQFDF